MDLDELADLFTREQALAAGLSDHRLRTMVRRGQLDRAAHGVYCRPQSPGKEADGGQASLAQQWAAHESDVRVVLKRLHAGYAASHLSAAAVHDLPTPLSAPPPVQVTAIEAYQRSRHLAGVVIHHCDSTLTELTVVNGVVTTTIARTVADCLRSHGPRVAVPIADHALHLNMTTLVEIESALLRQRRWVGRPRAMASLGLVDGRRESWLESWSFCRMPEWGIPMPTPQVVVRDASGRFIARTDGFWLDVGVVAETDGATKYESLPSESLEDTRRRVLYEEKRREDELRAVGLGVVRWGKADVVEPDALIVRIRNARLRGSMSAFTGSLVIPDPTGLTKLEI